MRDSKLYISIFLFSSGALAQNYNYGSQASNYDYNYNPANTTGYSNYNYNSSNTTGYSNYNYGNNATGNNTNSYGGNLTNSYSGANSYGANPYGGNTYEAQAPLNSYGNIPANANVMPQNMLPAAAPIEEVPPGPPAERSFRFERFGVPAANSYTLKWTDANRNATTIEVHNAESGELIQTLEVPQDESNHLVYSELHEPTAISANNFKAQVLDVVDYNFDSHDDLRLIKAWPYQPGGKSYAVWLYDVETSQYKFSPELSALPAPQVDRKNKRIESVELTGWGGAEYIKNIYKLTPENTLEVETRITHTIADSQTLTFARDIRTRVDGELQRVCKFTMPSEGRPKRVWGDRSTCKKYLVKGAPTRRSR